MDEERDEQTPSEFIDEEFDGVETAVDRGADTLVAFNFPLDISDISPASNGAAEFEASGKPMTRNIDALDFRPVEAINTEFVPGASFQVSSSIFAPTSLETKESQRSAPNLPSYLRPALTSFKSGKTLAAIAGDLEASFAAQSVDYAIDENSPCTYECSQMKMLSLIEFEVRIFSVDGKHLVEFKHLSGCRYGFGATYKTISETFTSNVTSAFVPMKFEPLSLSDDDELALPSLKRSPPVNVIDHELSMMDKSCDLEHQSQGVRAVASGLNLTEAEMFNDGGFGLPLAHRVVELASESTSDDGLRAVAMGAIANLASLDTVSNDWLNSTVNTVVAGVEDDHPHVKREALRSLEVLSLKNSSLAAKFVRAGVIPCLELEANGGADDHCKDLAAQKFADGALKACRA